MFQIAIFAGKLVCLISKTLRLGAGATWPGEIALRLDPAILQKFSKQQKNIILIAGTNGKTTTVKMVETILRYKGLSVQHNASGANLNNGLVSAFLTDAGWNGRLTSDYFIFEVDEATLPNILKTLMPNIIVLTNLFRDQLDRYGEVDVIAEKWQEALLKLDTGNQSIKMHQTVVIINADDPHVVLVGEKLATTVKYFGLEDASLFLPNMQHATDTIYCPRCGSRLTFGGVYFSHLGKWACGKCRLTHPRVDVISRDFPSPIEGVYNRYNTLAAAMVAKEVEISDHDIREALKNFTPAFGRMEEIDAEGKRVKILLSKNPTGFNESLRTVLSSKQKGPILLVLNDRIPDGTDVSWIWDVDFETLKNYKEKIFVCGDRQYDLGLRLKYVGTAFNMHGNLEEALQKALKETQKDQMLWILPTYSAMLDVRKILTGKKIL
ncbi:Mur ligase family protein [Candidatus Gottesmanbacteria bacterium]|nr:Mur ligase family protein [Candidatus Gottesmanbacteria bacterium]